MMAVDGTAETSGFAENIAPVSYTHLDVYKRQMEACMVLHTDISFFNRRPTFKLDHKSFPLTSYQKESNSCLWRTHSLPIILSSNVCPPSEKKKVAIT